MSGAREIELPTLETLSEDPPAVVHAVSRSEPLPALTLESHSPSTPPPVPVAYDDEKTDPGITPRLPPPPPSPAKITRKPPPPASTMTSTPPVVAAPPPLPTPRMPEMGLLDSFMRDPEVTEVMVNDLRSIMIEKGGVLGFSGARFTGLDELNRVVRNILDATGRILSPDSPYVDVMLPDGSRANIVAPPLTRVGPCLTIRKFPARSFALEDLQKFEMVNHRMAQFIRACVVGRMNILISGGTGTGKTTVLNALTGLIPKGERLVVIEDIPELRVFHANSVCLQTKPQTPGSGAISARELVANALRMRPDRIIVGECRKSEAFDMLQAMNTGHQGSMTTIHANSVRDGLHRLETLCLLGGSDLPLLAVRKQMVSAIDLVLQIRRFKTGKRRIVSISEVTGMEGETITLQDVFLFQQALDAQQPDAGEFVCTGLVPTFVDRLRENGVEIPRGFFA